MGLLDEAIREHLELKRRRGADPHELERVQHEALEPLDPHGELPAWVCGPAAEEAYEPLAAPAAVAAAYAGESIDQETVEVDMNALISQADLAEDEAAGAREGPITARRITSSPAGPPAEEFEWEVPNPRGAESREHEPASQESIAFE